MAWKIDRSTSALRDLALIFDFLTQSDIDFGESRATAIKRADRRVSAIEDAMEALALAPHQGTLRPDLAPGLREVTKGRAVFYFTLDESTETLRVLAIFFGAQDHHGRMLLRLLSPET